MLPSMHDAAFIDQRQVSHFCKADACFLQDFNWSWPQSTRLSMCSRSSSQVMTPGVESGGTNPSHWAQLGYAPTSLHMSSHIPASLLCSAARFLRSMATHALSSPFASTCREAQTAGEPRSTRMSAAMTFDLLCARRSFVVLGLPDWF